MNHKDKALRIASTAFRRMSYGTTYTVDELRMISDLCALALPMKYRFSREELNAMRAVVALSDTKLKITMEAGNGKRKAMGSLGTVSPEAEEEQRR